MTRSLAEFGASARARPPIKELFLIIPMHMMKLDEECKRAFSSYCCSAENNLESHSSISGPQLLAVIITPLTVVVWRSGNEVGRINEVTLRRARLVLEWVTCSGSSPGGGTLFRYVTIHPGRLSLSSFHGR